MRDGRGLKRMRPLSGLLAGLARATLVGVWTFLGPLIPWWYSTRDYFTYVEKYHGLFFLVREKWYCRGQLVIFLTKSAKVTRTTRDDAYSEMSVAWVDWQRPGSRCPVLVTVLVTQST